MKYNFITTSNIDFNLLDTDHRTQDFIVVYTNLLDNPTYLENVEHQLKHYGSRSDIDKVLVVSNDSMISSFWISYFKRFSDMIFVDVNPFADHADHDEYDKGLLVSLDEENMNFRDAIHRIISVPHLRESIDLVVIEVQDEYDYNIINSLVDKLNDFKALGFRVADIVILFDTKTNSDNQRRVSSNIQIDVINKLHESDIFGISTRVPAEFALYGRRFLGDQRDLSFSAPGMNNRAMTSTRIKEDDLDLLLKNIQAFKLITSSKDIPEDHFYS